MEEAEQSLEQALSITKEAEQSAKSPLRPVVRTAIASLAGFLPIALRPGLVTPVFQSKSLIPIIKRDIKDS